MNLLLLGESNTGKTVFVAQLYERANMGAELELTTTPREMRVIEEALQRLLEGKAPEHTRMGTTGTIVLPLRNQKGHTLDLTWPEYAGETFGRILTQRHLSPAWQQRIADADGILLLIRPLLKPDLPDVLTVPRRIEGEAPRAEESEADQDQPLAPDAQFVEMLQLLRFARGDGRLHRCTVPLAIVLTCWDELLEEDATPGTPGQELTRHYPLLAAYLDGAWHPNHVMVLGLSAWGGPFSDELGPSFHELGPAGRGYMIHTDGRKDTDLTCILNWLIETTHARSV